MADEPENLDIIAAEYVLGTLTDDERRRVRALKARHARFAARINGWQHRLAPLAEGSADVEPPRRVWERIDASLSGDDPWVRAPRVSSMRRRLRRWRTAAALAAAACIALAGYIGLSGLPEHAESGRDLMAVLSEGEAQAVVVVVVDQDQGRATIYPLKQMDRATRNAALELWMIPGEGEPPRSLGLLNPGRPVSLVLPESGPLTASTMLAVSREPAGGSPTGAPTGPVLYTGAVVDTSK